MATSKWLTDDQLKELVDEYYAGDFHKDEHVAKRQSQVKQTQDQLLNPDVFYSLSDEEFIERTLDIYRSIVRVPMYYKAIENHPQEVRAAVRYLIESDDDIVEKVENLRNKDGKHYRKGLGKTFWSLLIMAQNPAENPYWNNKTERALKALGMDYWSSGATPGEKYEAVIKAYEELMDLHPDADVLTLDHFMHYVTEMEGRKILQEWKGKDTSLPDESDEWVGRILKWQEEGLPEERISVRVEAEGEAKDLLEANLGHFDEDILRRFFELLNTDYYGGKRRRNRFSPAFVGGYANRIVEQIDLFNEWIPRLWNTGREELSELLDEFWNTKPIAYAGTILPTTILYLSNQEKYNIWIGKMVEGLEAINGNLPSGQDAETYFEYNKKVIEIREKYNLQPQELDVVFYRAAKLEKAKQVRDEIEKVEFEPDIFEGFSKDTFTFLEELEKNNEKEWFDENRDRYENNLREPLRDLFKDVGARIQYLDSNLETEAKFGKVMANINKRFADEEGPYHPYLWGAFYQADKKKQSAAQLFITVHPGHISIGIGVGAVANEELRRFKENINRYPEIFYTFLKPVLEKEFRVTTYEAHTDSEHKEIEIHSIEDVLKLVDLSYINIERHYTPSNDILYKSDLATEIADLFIMLYPLYLFFSSSDIEEDIATYIGEDELIEPEPGEQYSYEDLISDTYLDVDFLDRIELLIEGKGQVVFYGPPGTGKTYVAKKFAKYFVDQIA